MDACYNLNKELCFERGMNMGVKYCKQEIKDRIREELKCDYGFIKTLMADGAIEKLQNAYNNPDDSDDPKDIMEEIYQNYKDYCDAWKLDYEADNRDNKEYLKR